MTTLAARPYGDVGSGALSRAVDMHVEIGPIRVRLRSNVREVAAHLDLLYPAFPRTAGDGAHIDLAVVASRRVRRLLKPTATVVVNGATPFLPLAVSLAGPLVEWGLNWSIGRAAHRWVVVHAAVVERGGRAIVLPAPPGSGKSTLCAALALGGWRLLSDEFALVDPQTGHLSPLPRPVSLKNASIGIIRGRHSEVVLSPERLDVEGARFAHMRPPVESVRRAGEAARPAWVVLPKFAAGAQTRLTPLRKAEALIALADQSFNYNYLGTQGFTCLSELVRDASCYRLEFGDLDQALDRLSQATID